MKTRTMATCGRNALAIATLFTLACSDPIEPPVAEIVGEWTYSRTANAPSAKPSLNAGLRVTIAIDSATGHQLWGHVVLWFVGDVGLPANRFGPITGETNDLRAVVLRIAPGAAQPHGLKIEGEVDGDVLTVNASWLGVGPGPFPNGCRFQRSDAR